MTRCAPVVIAVPISIVSTAISSIAKYGSNPEHRFHRRDGAEVFAGEAAAAREDPREEVALFFAGPELALREFPKGSLLGDLGEQCVELTPRHRRQVRPHSAPEARHEVTGARDDDERALDRVVERERDAFGRRRQMGAVEDEAHRGVVAIELERELGLLASDAIESLEEMVRVRHGRDAG